MSSNLDEIQAKLFEIQYIRSKFQKDLAAKRKELIALAAQFESYEELYKYGKKISHSPEEFNEIMLMARDIFFGAPGRAGHGRAQLTRNQPLPEKGLEGSTPSPSEDFVLF